MKYVLGNRSFSSSGNHLFKRAGDASQNPIDAVAIVQRIKAELLLLLGTFAVFVGVLAKDSIGNVFGGLMLPATISPAVGSTFKVGHLKGHLVEIGITKTVLLTPEGFPLSVPNSFLYGRANLITPNAPCRCVVAKIHLRTDDLDKIPPLVDDLNPKDIPGEVSRFCFVSRIESSFVQLTIVCFTEDLSEDECRAYKGKILFYSLLKAKEHGCMPDPSILGGPVQVALGRAVLAFGVLSAIVGAVLWLA